MRPTLCMQVEPGSAKRSRMFNSADICTAMSQKGHQRIELLPWATHIQVLYVGIHA